MRLASDFEIPLAPPSAFRRSSTFRVGPPYTQAPSPPRTTPCRGAGAARGSGRRGFQPGRRVGTERRVTNERRRGCLGTHPAIDESTFKKGFIYATIFSDPGRGVVIDVGPGRDGAVVWAFAGLYRAEEREAVRVVTIDSHAAYRYPVRLAFQNARIVAEAVHLHRQANHALAEVRRAARYRLREAGTRRLAR